MTAATRHLTADELRALPDDGRHAYELVRGELRVREPAGARHGEIGSLILVLLARHALAHRLGRVFNADTGFFLQREPDTVRAPDVSFVRGERIPAGGVGSKYFDGAPDLAVEILSPDDSALELEDKVAEYLAAGGRLVWVVNPRRETVTVHAPGASPRVLRADDAVDGGDVLPGFACVVREMLVWPA